MSISFKNETYVQDLKQVSYFMSNRDKKVMNEILNSLLKEDQVQKVSLRIITLASSSVFVIWKNKKSRVMMNLRRINTRLYSDAYSLSKQDIILFSLREITVFFSINLIKGFFQQETRKEDWWKTTFVIPHRELEWLIVASMSRVAVGLNKTRRECPNPIHWWGWTPYFVQWVGLDWWVCSTPKPNPQPRRPPPIWKKGRKKIIF
jgi:hypothetical protein